MLIHIFFLKTPDCDWVRMGWLRTGTGGGRGGAGIGPRLGHALDVVGLDTWVGAVRVTYDCQSQGRMTKRAWMRKPSSIRTLCWSLCMIVILSVLTLGVLCTDLGL